MKFSSWSFPSLRRVKALVIKECFQILRDPSSLIIATLFPIFLLSMYGYGVSLDLKNLKVGLVLQDTSDPIENFTSSLKDSPFFDLQIAKDPHAFSQALSSTKLDAIVWIPPYFSNYFEKALSKDSSERAPIYVITDGSSPNTATFAQNYILAAWANWKAQEAISSGSSTYLPIRLQPRFWFNEELNSRHFLVPGSIAIIITLIGTLLTALMISREWERGTMEALMATPVTIYEILLSKLIPYFILGIISVALSTLIGHYFFEVPLRGSIFALMIVSLCFLIVALAIGLLISAFCRDQFEAAQISIISAFLPAFMLSGFIFEIDSMPLWIRIITYLLPARYFVSSLQTLFLAGDVWVMVTHTSMILICFALILFVIIAKKTKKRID